MRSLSAPQGLPVILEAIVEAGAGDRGGPRRAASGRRTPRASVGRGPSRGPRPRRPAPLARTPRQGRRPASPSPERDRRRRGLSRPVGPRCLPGRPRERVRRPSRAPCTAHAPAPSVPTLTWHPRPPTHLGQGRDVRTRRRGAPWPAQRRDPGFCPRRGDRRGFPTFTQRPSPLGYPTTDLREGESSLTSAVNPPRTTSYV